MNEKCVFAGTFDPPTLGHKAVVEDALKLFQEVVVAVLVNPQKQPLFSVEERKEMLRLDLPQKGVKIVEFEGTVAELMRREGAEFYVRGIRNTVDFEFEQANYFASQKIDKNVKAVYIPCKQELLHVSSSMARNCLAFGADLSDYVSEEVKAYIKAKKK
ncbi:MAG: pantetheine-phosphate adenylyltransferase [Clostridia bacterium]|nr:pantetheine-phosphate adenylyltransferase [Clostridia bacterium]